MKITLSFAQFLDNWPESRKDQFSYDALEAIFEYLTGYEESGGEELEFDPIAICCEYTEYKTALEAAQEYGYEEVASLEEKSLDLLEVAALEEAQALEWLQDSTTVLELGNGGVVIQQF